MNFHNPTTHAFDGTPVPTYQYLPCNARATFDGNHSYRCDTCGAVVGSIAQPRECVEEAKKYDVLKALGSSAYWDYDIGKERA